MTAVGVSLVLLAVVLASWAFVECCFPLPRR